MGVMSFQQFWWFHTIHSHLDTPPQILVFLFVLPIAQMFLNLIPYLKQHPGQRPNSLYIVARIIVLCVVAASGSPDSLN